MSKRTDVRDKKENKTYVVKTNLDYYDNFKLSALKQYYAGTEAHVLRKLIREKYDNIIYRQKVKQEREKEKNGKI